ncbi:putative stage 0 sporulation protein J [Peptostreptococcaceae bacterium oral taxon 113 str. W5053]|nr:putative stage 0 sporulation protein J [Peptostreptococcaceae bacterium oral taxon 113 str. W5053]
MITKKKLGRGLSNLIPAEMATATIEEVIKSSGNLKDLPIDRIHPKKDQPRTFFDESKLKELENSIREHGILQPILVRETEEGFEIIAGERRFRAGSNAQLKSIPAIVLDVDEETSAQLSIIENVQREDLNPVEEAVAYDNILRDFSWTQEELGKRLGKSRSYISNTLRLLKLETEYLEALKEGQITSSQARTLLAMESKERKKFYKKLCNKETNVREMEKAVKQKTINLYQKQIEEELCERFATKVRVTKKKQGGKIEFDFYSDDDLERVLEMFRQ